MRSIHVKMKKKRGFIIMAKEKINVFDYAEKINKQIAPGILLNTNCEKFNSMVIGWGHLGVIWGLETFTVYVRDSRFTKKQLDKTGRFTLSMPLDGSYDPEGFRVFGTMSGYDMDKSEYITQVPANVNFVPGIKEYPLTIECEVIYKQRQDPEAIDKQILRKYYSVEETKDDHHTMYIGKIVDAYIIR